MSDQDDAEVYTDVAIEVRQALGVSGLMYIHPYVAVIADDSGMPRVDMTTFEYEPSTALALLHAADSTLVLCQVGAQGMCVENYIVFSQIARIGDRDAVVVVRSIRGSGTGRVLFVRLRYGREGWSVAGSELIP